LDSAPLGFIYRPGAKLSESKRAKWTQLKYDTATQLLQLPENVRAAVATPSVIAHKRSLVVEDVKLPLKSGSYNVFVGNPPDAGADPSTAPNYVGYIGIIVGEHKHDHKCSLVLQATNQFLQTASGAGASLTFAAAGATNGDNLDFGSAYLTEE
jgi:hypothetical protein